MTKTRHIAASALFYCLFQTATLQAGQYEISSCAGTGIGTAVPPTGCGTCFVACAPPIVVAGPTYALDSGTCDPAVESCAFTANVFVEFPGNRLNNNCPDYSPSEDAQLGNDVCPLFFCQGNGDYDFVTEVVTGTAQCGVSQPLDLNLRMCVSQLPGCGACGYITTVPIDASAYFCPPEPPTWGCGEGDSSAANACCIGPGGGAPPAGGGGPRGGFLGFANRGAGGYYIEAGHAYAPERGAPVAMKLRYLYGGAGGYRMPENAAWGGRLGRHWSHEFAERIVPSPDESTVWLITKAASFRKFTNLDLSGIYATALPSDEYRELEWLGVGNGWVLRDLDGTATYFRADGLWDRTEDRQNPTQPSLPPLAAATYDGSPRLTSVTFRDGTRIDFFYYPSGTSAGMLQTLRRVGVGGSPTSDWTYTWSNTAGRDLTRIDRPDGSRWEFLYDNSFPRHMSSATLVGVGGSPSRIEGAWAYDTQGRLAQAWKGSASFSTGMEKYSWNYVSDTETRVVDSYGNEATYTFSRDPVSFKPRLLSIAGECGTCGSSPNSSWTYDDNDLDNPMRATSVTDGNGVITQYEYDPFGRMTYKLEAAGVLGSFSLPRETAWEYHPIYHAMLTTKSGPTKQGETPTRVLRRVYDLATGNLERESRAGLEENYPGGSFDLTTEYLNYNPAGRVEFVDPPAFASSDRTRFTYDVPGRSGTLPDQRFDPLIGTPTVFEYDAFNRRTGVTDPNGATTLTEYDALDRVTRITAYGDPSVGTDDRVTTFTYNNLGDLFCVKRPDLVGSAYFYDAGGRLVEEHRGTAIGTPTSSTCLQLTDSTLRERTFFVLNANGDRLDEVRQRTTTSTFATPVLGNISTYQFWRRNTYSSACHLDKVTVAPTQGESVTEYGYDCAGNLTSVWDPLHLRASNPTEPSTSYSYDEVNRLIETASPWGNAGTESQSTTYRYDAQDHLVVVIDGNGIGTSYSHSDRDLLTREMSVVGGVTTHAYNDHGEKVSTTDARGVVVTRVPDAADRIQSIAYPDSSLDTTYTYGDEVTPTPPQFSLGRVVSIARGASTIGYTWSGHGQRLSDGVLGFTYNPNGLPATVSYPGGLVATYGYDKMNRETSLSIQESPNPAINIVLGGTSAATYNSFGPLTSYTLGTTASHAVTRGYDLRYAPTSITVAGTPTLLNWTLATDLAGNLLTIDDTLATNYDRTFTYHDYQYYLATASGPWGPTLAWTYDKVGNRLTEDDPLSGPPVPDFTYNYELFGFAGARTTKLMDIDSSIYEPAYSYTDAGHVTQIAAGAAVLDITNDDAGQISLFDNPEGTNVSMDYDGRGFLWEGLFASASTSYLRPVYDSSGRLLGIDRKPSTKSPEEKHRVVYFAGLPIAIWKKVGTADATTTYLTTDHIGTPIHALGSNGTTVVWSGGFEPFGRDWNEFTVNDALSKGIFLRLPGQWVDEFWRSEKVGAKLYYNLHRWYEPQTGRYTSVDPLSQRGDPHPYAYARANPLRFVDALGLKSRVCCRTIPGALGFRHCYIESQSDQGGQTTCGLVGGVLSGGSFATGQIYDDNSFDSGGDCGGWTEGCGIDQCVVDSAKGYANPSEYRLARGPNSNTFAGTIARSCGISPPASEGAATPGWNDSPAPLKSGEQPIPVGCHLP